MNEEQEPILDDGLIRIEWDRIGQPDCLTLNGQPLKCVNAIKMEWPAGAGMLPVLTLTQIRVRSSRKSTLVHEGYFVPRDLWDEYQGWRKAQR